jgi:NAD+ diphosphatase
LRADAVWQAGAVTRSDARVVALAGTRNLVDAAGQHALCPTRAAAPQLFDAARELVFLGLLDGAPCYAALHDAEPATTAGGFVELRSVLATLDGDDLSLLIMARALAHWHDTHRHCGACGAPTTSFRAGHARTCTACSREAFPRLDPAVIVLVADESRCLLGRNPQWPAGRFSTLAGFVEPGETLEDAVAREVREESGIRIAMPAYVGSQPWPFPASLMLGFEARPLTDAIEVDGEELAEARWFTRADITAGLADGSLSLSPRRSIAFRLLERWFDRGGTPLRNLSVT